MSTAHTESMPEELFTLDNLWFMYSYAEKQRDVCLRNLQGYKDGEQPPLDLLNELDELTELVDSLAANIVAGVLMECYEQDASLYVQTAAPSFDTWLHTLIAKYRDIFNCDAYPELRNVYHHFGSVRMLELIPLVNESLQLNGFGVQFGDTYLEVASPAQS